MQWVWGSYERSWDTPGPQDIGWTLAIITMVGIIGSFKSSGFQNFFFFAGSWGVIQVYTPTSNAEEAEVEWLYEDLQDLLGLTNTPK